MRIITRKQLREMPAGVLYMAYEPCVFGECFLKGDSIGNDWLCSCVIGAVAWGTSGDIFERCDAMVQGASFPCDFTAWGRDGLFEPDDRLYAIYEPEDVRRLIATLQRFV
jgi:hypothetical protein